MAGLTALQFLQGPVGMRFMRSRTHARMASMVCCVTFPLRALEPSARYRNPIRWMRRMSGQFRGEPQRGGMETIQGSGARVHENGPGLHHMGTAAGTVLPVAQMSRGCQWQQWQP